MNYLNLKMVCVVPALHKCQIIASVCQTINFTLLNYVPLSSPFQLMNLCWLLVNGSYILTKLQKPERERERVVSIFFELLVIFFSWSPHKTHSFLGFSKFLAELMFISYDTECLAYWFSEFSSQILSRTSCYDLEWKITKSSSHL